MYTKHMKRTTLMLDENLMETATRLLGVKTYSETVNRALEEVIRLVKIRGLSEFVGSGIWSGNLSEMRDDRRK